MDGSVLKLCSGSQQATGFGGSSEGRFLMNDRLTK